MRQESKTFPTMKPQAGGAISILQMKKVKLKKVKLLAQGHIASKQYSRFGLRSADTKALAGFL